MAIRPLIDISCKFSTLVKTDNFSPAAMFILPSLTDQYNRLSTHDRLRVFGIIWVRNFFKEATAKHVKPQDFVDAFEEAYSTLSMKCQTIHIRKMNDTGDFSAENRHRTKIFGCIPAYIAVDLADAIEARSDTAHTPTPGPV